MALTDDSFRCLHGAGAFAPSLGDRTVARGSSLQEPALPLDAGEAPDEPLHPWLGRSLALPKVFNGIDFAKMFRAVASPSRRF